MTEFEVGPFAGMESAADSRYIRATSSRDQLNVRTWEDAVLRPRYGYRVLGQPSGVREALGFEYVRGFSSAGSETDYYVAFDKAPGASEALPWKIAPRSGTRAQLWNGDAVPALSAAGDWRGFTFDGNAYFFNATAGEVFKHEIGTTTVFSQLEKPDAPVAAPILKRVFTLKGEDKYDELRFDGLTAGEIEYGGNSDAGSTTINADGSITLGHTASDADLSGIRIEMTDLTVNTPRNWKFNDNFGGTIQSLHASFKIDPTSFRFKVECQKASGTIVVIHPTKATVVTTVSGGRPTYAYHMEFAEKDRELWEKVVAIKFNYVVVSKSATAADNKLRINPVTIGCVNWPDTSPENLMEVRYTRRLSTTGSESDMSPSRKITANGFKLNSKLPDMGCFIEMRMEAQDSPIGADQRSIYMRHATQTGTANSEPYRLVTIAKWDQTRYVIPYGFADLDDLTEYDSTTFDVADISCAFPFQEWVVWCYKQSRANVRHSRIGQPTKLADEDDDINDIVRGADYTLDEFGSDYPVAGIPAGRALILFGTYSVYAQVGIGDGPSSLTPIRRLPGSKGIANPLACSRYVSDQGTPGAVFMDRAGEGIWFANVSGQFDGDQGFVLQELSAAIKKGPHGLDWLLGSDRAEGLTLVRLAVDEGNGSLWAVCRDRALVLRPPSPATGERHWEPNDYRASWKFLAPSTSYRLRGLRTSSVVDSIEFDVVKGSYIGGPNRDGGSPMFPRGFWETKKFSGPNRRLMRVSVLRDFNANVEVFAYCRRKPDGQVVYLNQAKLSTQVPASIRGEDVWVRVIVTEGDECIRRIKLRMTDNLGGVKESW